MYNFSDAPVTVIQNHFLPNPQDAGVQAERAIASGQIDTG
jgi:hypothetical protein